MDKYEIIWTPKAFKSLQKIRQFLETNSKSRSEKIVKGLIAYSLVLETFPRKNPVESTLGGLKHECRFLVKGNYKIIFAVLETEKIVLVGYVFDTRQSPDKIRDVWED